MLIDQTTLHLPKDNEEINAHVKRLHTILDTATIVDPALDCDNEAQVHEHDHQQSPHGDLASGLTPVEECGQR
jgi:hypothetical protein